MVTQILDITNPWVDYNQVTNYIYIPIAQPTLVKDERFTIGFR
jgi:hypothetical protein